MASLLRQEDMAALLDRAELRFTVKLRARQLMSQAI